MSVVDGAPAQSSLVSSSVSTAARILESDHFSPKSGACAAAVHAIKRRPDRPGSSAAAGVWTITGIQTCKFKLFANGRRRANTSFKLRQVNEILKIDRVSNLGLPQASLSTMKTKCARIHVHEKLRLHCSPT